MLDSMVRWYLRKSPFTTWDQCSRRMEISIKMLVIDCLRLQIGPIYRPILLGLAGLIQPIPIIIGAGHVRMTDTKDTDLWCQLY
jgi:hypothetical protein